MSDVDIVLEVATKGIENVYNLSNAMKQLNLALNGAVNPIKAYDARAKALSTAVGATNAALNNHAKTIQQVARNQAVLSGEIGRVRKELEFLNKGYTTATGVTSTFAKRGIQDLQNYEKALKSVKFGALAADLKSVAIEQKRLGKDAQFVGRSLIIGLTTPIMGFARYGLQALVGLDREFVRLNKVLESISPNLEDAANKMGVNLKGATDAQIKSLQTLVDNYNKLDQSLSGISSKFGTSKELVVSLAGEFAELGIQSTEGIAKITELTAATEKLGNMDIGNARKLVQSLYFQAVRAMQQSGESRNMSAMERETAAIASARAQLALFNAVENTTALTLKDLGDSFPEVAAAATTFGLSMTEATALLAPMKAAGMEVGASANAIKISLQSIVSPTKKTEQMFESLTNQYGEHFKLIKGTGLDAIQALIDAYQTLEKSSAGQEGVLQFFEEIFGKRQSTRMLVGIQQLAEMDSVLKDNSVSAARAEKQIQAMANSAIVSANKASGANLPLVDSYKSIGVIARVATATAGQAVEGFSKKVSQSQIDAAIKVRDEISKGIFKKSQKEGIDLIGQVATESGRAMFIELAGVKNAQEVADRELDRSLKSLEVTIQRMKNGFKMFAADMLTAIRPALEKVSQFVTKLYDAWTKLDPATKSAIAKLTVGIGAVTAAIGPLIFMFGQFRLAMGSVASVVFSFLPALKTMTVEMVAANSKMLNLTKPLVVMGETVVNTNGKFATFIATVASGGGPLKTFAEKVGITTGVLQKQTTATFALTAAVNEMKTAKAGLGGITLDGSPMDPVFYSSTPHIPKPMRKGLDIVDADGTVLHPKSKAAVAFKHEEEAYLKSRGLTLTSRGSYLGKTGFVSKAEVMAGIEERTAKMSKFRIIRDYYGKVSRDGIELIDKDLEGLMRRRPFHLPVIAKLKTKELVSNFDGLIRSLIPKADKFSSHFLGYDVLKKSGTGLFSKAKSLIEPPAPLTSAVSRKGKNLIDVATGSVLKPRSALAKEFLQEEQFYLSKIGASVNARGSYIGATGGFLKKEDILAGISNNRERMAKLGITRTASGNLMRKGRQIEESVSDRLITGGFGAVPAKLKLGLQDTGAALSSFGGKFMGVLKNPSSILPKITGMFTKFGTVITGLLPSLSSMGSMLAFTGVGAAIAGVIAVIIIVVKHWKEFHKAIQPGIKAFKEAFDIIKQGVMDAIQPIIKFFQTFTNDGDTANGVIVALSYAFNFLAEAVKFVAKIIGWLLKSVVGGAFSMALKPIVAMIKGVISFISGIVEIFHGNFSKGFHKIVDGIGKVIVGLMGPFAGLFSGILKMIAKVMDAMSHIPFVGGIFKKAGDGLRAVAGYIDKAREMGKKGAEAGAKKVAPDPDTRPMQEKIANSVGTGIKKGADAGAESLNKLNKKLSAELKREIQDDIADRIKGAMANVVTSLTDALKGQKEQSLKIYDDQLKKIEETSKAEERLTKTKEYENKKRELEEKRALDRLNSQRNYNLAIYEGRIDDARQISLEGQKAELDAQKEMADIESSRKKELADQRKEDLVASIKDARDVASKYYDDMITSFTDAAKKITEFPPTTAEKFNEQLKSLTDKAKELAGNIGTKTTEGFTGALATLGVDATGPLTSALGTISDVLVKNSPFGPDGIWQKTIDESLVALKQKYEGLTDTLTMVIDKNSSKFKDLFETYKKYKELVAKNEAELAGTSGGGGGTGSSTGKTGGNVGQTGVDYNPGWYYHYKEKGQKFWSPWQGPLDKATIDRLQPTFEKIGLFSAQFSNYNPGTTTFGATQGTAANALYGRNAFAIGGVIPYGQGGPTKGPVQQGIPAILHGGEYVVRNSAVKKYGWGMMQQINQGTFKPRPFANGGMIDKARTTINDTAAEIAEFSRQANKLGGFSEYFWNMVQPRESEFGWSEDADKIGYTLPGKGRKARNPKTGGLSINNRSWEAYGGQLLNGNPLTAGQATPLQQMIIANRMAVLGWDNPITGKTIKNSVGLGGWSSIQKPLIGKTMNLPGYDERPGAMINPLDMSAKERAKIFLSGEDKFRKRQIYLMKHPEKAFNGGLIEYANGGIVDESRNNVHGLKAKKKKRGWLGNLIDDVSDITRIPLNAVKTATQGFLAGLSMPIEFAFAEAGSIANYIPGIGHSNKQGSLLNQFLLSPLRQTTAGQMTMAIGKGITSKEHVSSNELFGLKGFAGFLPKVKYAERAQKEAALNRPTLGQHTTFSPGGILSYYGLDKTGLAKEGSKLYGYTQGAGDIIAYMLADPAVGPSGVKSMLTSPYRFAQAIPKSKAAWSDAYWTAINSNKVLRRAYQEVSDFSSYKNSKGSILYGFDSFGDDVHLSNAEMQAVRNSPRANEIRNTLRRSLGVNGVTSPLPPPEFNYRTIMARIYGEKAAKAILGEAMPSRGGLIKRIKSNFEDFMIGSGIKKTILESPIDTSQSQYGHTLGHPTPGVVYPQPEDVITHTDYATGNRTGVSLWFAEPGEAMFKTYDPRFNNPKIKNLQASTYRSLMGRLWGEYYGRRVLRPLTPEQLRTGNWFDPMYPYINEPVSKIGGSIVDGFVKMTNPHSEYSALNLVSEFTNKSINRIGAGVNRVGTGFDKFVLEKIFGEMATNIGQTSGTRDFSIPFEIYSATNRATSNFINDLKSEWLLTNSPEARMARAEALRSKVKQNISISQQARSSSGYSKFYLEQLAEEYGLTKQAVKKAVDDKLMIVAHHLGDYGKPEGYGSWEVRAVMPGPVKDNDIFYGDPLSSTRYTKKSGFTFTVKDSPENLENGNYGSSVKTLSVNGLYAGGNDIKSQLDTMKLLAAVYQDIIKKYNIKQVINGSYSKYSYALSQQFSDMMEFLDPSVRVITPKLEDWSDNGIRFHNAEDYMILPNRGGGASPAQTYLPYAFPPQQGSRFVDLYNLPKQKILNKIILNKILEAKKLAKNAGKEMLNPQEIARRAEELRNVIPESNPIGTPGVTVSQIDPITGQISFPIDIVGGPGMFNGGLIEYAKGGIVDESRKNAIGLKNIASKNKISWWNLGSGETWKAAGNVFTSGKAWNWFVKTGKDTGKSMWRTVTGQNWTDASKLPEDQQMAGYRKATTTDTLNWAQIIPLLGKAAKVSEIGIGALKSRLAPTADLSEYIIHGGVSELKGGIIDPDFVRGGDLYKTYITDRIVPSVKSGPNEIERRYWLEMENAAKKALNNDYTSRSKFELLNPNEEGYLKGQALIDKNNETKARASEWLERHQEIIRRVKAGEEHGTGVHPITHADNAYASQGKVYVLKPNRLLQTSDSPAPPGEVKFFGKQKPVAGIAVEGTKTKDAIHDALQAMIDDADLTSFKNQKIRNLVERMRGVKITPAYKEYLIKLFEKDFAGTTNTYIRNPDFGKGPRDLLEWMTEYPSKYVPAVKNYDQVVSLIRKAKTENQVLHALSSTQFGDFLEIAMQNRLNRLNPVDVLAKIMESARNFSGSYTRPIGRFQYANGGIVPGFDSMGIPSILHGGEYVINSKAVKNIGFAALEAMNNMRFQTPKAPSYNGGVSGQATSSSTVHIYVDNFIGEKAWFESMMKDYNINVGPQNQKAAGLQNRTITTYNGINRGL